MARVTIGNQERGTSYTLDVNRATGSVGPSTADRSWRELETPAGHAEAGPLGEVPRVQEFNGSFYTFNIDRRGDGVTARAFSTREAAEATVWEWRWPASRLVEEVAHG